MKADLFRQLAALGLSTEQIAGVLDIMDAEAEERKEKGRARWRKWKDGQPANVSKRLPTTANVSSQLAGAEPSSSSSPPSGKEKKEDTSPSARSRGTRISDDFVPDIEAAMAEGLSRQDAEREARTFCDYWRARPGKEALKMDWPATWRVWFRKRLDDKQPTAPPRGKRSFADVAIDKFSGQANGTASIFGSDSDAEFLPPRGSESRPDDGHLRGGVGLRAVPGGR